MDCREVQDWLLKAEDLRLQSCKSPEIARHLDACAACRQMAGRLCDLEDAWRALPMPMESERSKLEFLARLSAAGGLDAGTRMPGRFSGPSADPDALASSASPSSRDARSRRMPRRRWLQWSLTAAAGASAAGVGAWMFMGGPEAQASDTLLDELVEWNLRLTEADSAAERERLYRERADSLRSSIEGAKLQPEWQPLAESLVENGAWLATHKDPVTEASRFDGLAERLLDLSQRAEKSGNHRRVRKLLGQYNRVLESGVNPNIEHIESSGILDFEHQRKLERIALRSTEQVRKLATLLENAPNASRQEIERALKLRSACGKSAHAKKSRAKKKFDKAKTDQ